MNIIRTSTTDEDRKTKYQMCHIYQESLNSLVSQRYLAMLRGELEKILHLKHDFPRAELKRTALSMCQKD
jgi:transcriptional accessory protein Tex/SPT6